MRNRNFKRPCYAFCILILLLFVGCRKMDKHAFKGSLDKITIQTADSLYEAANWNAITLLNQTNATWKTIDSLTFGYAGINGTDLNFGLATPFIPIKMASYSNNFKQRNFILLPFLTLKRLDKNNADLVYNEYVFFVKDGKSFIRRRNDNFKNVPFFIQFKSGIPLPRFAQFKDLTVYLPMDDKNSFSFLSFLFRANAYIIAILILIVFILSLLVVISIANNKAFFLQNAKRLKYCTWIMLLIVIIPYIAPLFLYFKYWKSWNESFAIKSIWNIVRVDQWIMLIIYFVLSVAFKRGYKLQSEQEYTI